MRIHGAPEPQVDRPWLDPASGARCPNEKEG